MSAFFLIMALSSGIGLGISPVQAATDTPSKIRPLFTRALNLLKKRQFRKAIEKLTLVIERGPTGNKLQALAYYNRGLAFQALRQLDLAREDYSRAIELQTLSDKILKVVYYNRGLVYDGLKRPQAALDDFTSAIEKNPEFSPAYHNRGNVLRKMGKLKAAITNFLKSLQLGNPQPYLTYMGLALAYEGAGRRKEAITSLKYALDIQPRFKKASDMLARLTTEDIYTFPTKTALSPDQSPIYTGSIPQNSASQDLGRKKTRDSSELGRFELGLRGIVEAKTEPVKYQKLALRGTLTRNFIGRVALVVPGPGFKEAQKAARSTPLPRRKPALAGKKPVAGLYKVQLGTSKTSARANKLWFFLKAQNSDLLENLNPVFQRVSLGKRGILYRIQVGPFKSRAAASQLCKAMIERAVNCFPVRRNGT